MGVKCGPGELSTLTFDNPDCPDCRSLKNVVQSADDKTLTFYYTDGTSQQFVLPVGTGTPGEQGATGKDGTSLIWSDPADHTAAATFANTNITTGTTLFATPGKNLVNVGDSLKIHAVVYTASTNTAVNSNVNVLINSTVISLFPNAGVNYVGSGIPNMSVYDFTITLKDATALNQMLRIEGTLTNYLQVSALSWAEHDVQNTQQDLGAQDFTAQNNNFHVQINQPVASVTICSEWRGEIYKV